MFCWNLEFQTCFPDLGDFGSILGGPGWSNSGKNLPNNCLWGGFEGRLVFHGGLGKVLDGFWAGLGRISGGF